MASPATSGKLGTFAGVFTPSVLTILGIILFLRLGYVVGAAGLGETLLIISLASAISMLTSWSVAAIATNIRVKAGGDYYLISRTLGLGFGGAIGLVLFLAQAVSIGFYCIGFAEATAALLPVQAPWITPALAAVAVAALFVLAWLGSDWATRFQYVVMVLIVLSLAVFVAGAYGRWDLVHLTDNWSPPADGLSFGAAFAVFFPAVTGFTQGVSMSGDLANPGRSIPRGVFAAVALSTLVYFGCAVLFAATLPRDVLATDYSAMQRVALWGPVISAGVMAATLSSALASFLGAPRILQSLARDRIFPSLNLFAFGSGPDGNPRRGVLLSGAIALAVIALGSLNLVAALVSMFFLVSYGLLNYATWFEARSGSPSFRPGLRYYDKRASLVGGLTCLGAMLALSPAAGAAAVAVVFALYQYLRYRAVPARWADSRRSYHLQRVREHLLAAREEREHPRDWRPHCLVLSDDAQRRARLLRFADWIEGGAGLVTALQVIEGQGVAAAERRRLVQERLEQELGESGAQAFPLVVTAPKREAAVATVLQAAGIGPVRINTLVTSWLADAPGFMGTLREKAYSGSLLTAFRLGCNLLVLNMGADALAALDRVPARDRRIDVWCSGSTTGELLLLLAYLMTRHPDWEGAGIRLLAGCGESGAPAEREAELRDMLEKARIQAEPVVIDEGGAEALVQHSRDASLVFLPFGIHGGRFYHPLGGEIGEVLGSLPVVALGLAAQDVDLDAEPEEGVQAETAAMRDRIERARDAAFKRSKEAEDATTRAAEASEALELALADGAKSEVLAEIYQALRSAEAEAREAARRAAHDEAIAQSLEEQAKALGMDPRPSGR